MLPGGAGADVSTCKQRPHAADVFSACIGHLGPFFEVQDGWSLFNLSLVCKRLYHAVNQQTIIKWRMLRQLRIKVLRHVRKVLRDRTTT
jgi:hypothetical protein